MKPILLAIACGSLLFATGCFRISPETRDLRDAALSPKAQGVEEIIEFGAGRFTFGLAKAASKFVDLPPEARVLFSSVKGAECSVFEFESHGKSLPAVLAKADRSMQKRGWTRVVGVVEARQLVAVYIPGKMNSSRKVRFSVLVLDDRQLVCASASGNIDDILKLGLDRAREHLLPPDPHLASN